MSEPNWVAGATNQVELFERTEDRIILRALIGGKHFMVRDPDLFDWIKSCRQSIRDDLFAFLIWKYEKIDWSKEEENNFYQDESDSLRSRIKITKVEDETIEPTLSKTTVTRHLFSIGEHEDGRLDYDGFVKFDTIPSCLDEIE